MGKISEKISKGFEQKLAWFRLKTKWGNQMATAKLSQAKSQEQTNKSKKSRVKSQEQKVKSKRQKAKNKEQKARTITNQIALNWKTSENQIDEWVTQNTKKTMNMDKARNDPKKSRQRDENASEHGPWEIRKRTWNCTINNPRTQRNQDGHFRYQPSHEYWVGCNVANERLGLCGKECSLCCDWTDREPRLSRSNGFPWNRWKSIPSFIPFIFILRDFAIAQLM